MMKPHAFPPHWLTPDTLAHATVAQREMAAKVVMADPLQPPCRLAGADISHLPRQRGAKVHAAVVVLDAALAQAEHACASLPPRFPYVPGYLGFREVPALVAAFATLPAPWPDLVFVDGHGISHPRGLGVATHLGVLLDIPTIGVAKSILVGALATPLPPEPGGQADLVWQGRTIGRALRTRQGANPVYVSVGHRMTLDSAVAAVRRAATGRRLPEPTRLAHLAANACRLRDGG